MAERMPPAAPIQPAQGDRKSIWMRGLWMLVFALLFEVGKSVLALGAVFQFVWMLVTG